MMQPEELIDTCLSRMEAGEELWLRVTGNSMLPFFVHLRDSVCLRPTNGQIRRGDIVLFRRDNGSLILHRVAAVKDKGLFLVGDGQTQREGPISSEYIIARAERAMRKGKQLTPQSFLWIFFKTVWLWILPFRSPALRLYRALRRNDKEMV